MAVTVPSFIPTPFASEGQFAIIPDAPSSEQGRASWQQGFPQVCAQPLASGGIPPNYQDFQGIFNALSAAICYMQTGALWPWSATLTYPLGAHVLGSDNNEYVAVQENTGQDPTTDTTQTYWEPGITATSVFTAPTASAPGKAGLVPGPEATPENELLLRFCSARGWGKLAPQFFDRVWTTEGADTLTLGIIVVPNDTNIDTLTTPGRYYCSQFQSIFGAHAGMVEVYYMKGSTSDDQRSALQIYYCDAGFIAARGASKSFPVDGTPSFTPTWTTWSVPRPQTAAGLGQWRLLWGGIGAGPSVTLPDGAVWAYHVIGLSQTGEVISGDAGVLGGGTVITLTNVAGKQITDVVGFCWEVLA